MNIVVMGTGGVGGYFGARLANAGHNVSFIARGKHLEAIKNNGLKIISETGDILIHQILKLLILSFFALKLLIQNLQQN